jgi:hypothetical protein
LNKAREFEVVLIPASEGSYNFEEGVLLKNTDLITQALGKLDPDWERELIARCYQVFAARRTSGTAVRATAAEELFVLNRGALLQAGIALPVEINLRGEQLGRREKVMSRALAKAGFARTAAAQNAKVRFRLDITIQGGAASCELTDTEGEGKPLRRAIPLRSLSKVDIYAFARSLSNFVFRVE